LGKRKVQGHGTRACYCRGCDHPECKAENARYQRERRWRLGINRPASEKELLPCGTAAAYKRKCRCKKCRRANADERALYKRKRKIREEWML